MFSPAIRTDRSVFIGGVALAFTGALLFSMKAIQIKLAYRYGVDALSLLALRMLFALPFYLAIAYYDHRRNKLQEKLTGADWSGGAIFGLSGYYAASLLDFMGLQYITAGLERLVLFVYPTLVLVFSAILFKTNIQRIHYWALGATYLGMAIALGADLRMGVQRNLWLGVFLVFASAATYAVYMIGSGRVMAKFGVVRFTCFSMIVATLAIGAHVGIVKGFDSLLHFPPIVYQYGLQLAIFSTVLPSFMISTGIRRIGSDNTSIIGTVGPVATIMFAFYFLGESIYLLQVVGSLLVIGGVLLIGLKGKR